MLIIDRVKKTFRSRNRITEVLRGISLEVPAGSLCVIRGRSGVGKSTLLSLVAGLEPFDEGSIEAAGHRLEQLSPPELTHLRRTTIGMIFQSFNLLAAWTAAENLEAPLMHAGRTPAERRELVEGMLEHLHLADRGTHLPAELSVGQQQRIAIGRTLIADPKIILADEPTGDVDPETAEEIISLLLSRRKEAGTTILVATHGSFPLDRADQVWTLTEAGLSQG